MLLVTSQPSLKFQRHALYRIFNGTMFTGTDNLNIRHFEKEYFRLRRVNIGLFVEQNEFCILRSQNQRNCFICARWGKYYLIVPFFVSLSFYYIKDASLAIIIFSLEYSIVIAVCWCIRIFPYVLINKFSEGNN